MKKIELHWQIIIGMILGVVFGLALLNFDWGKSFVIDWIKPFGTIFINSLKLIAVPLILASLIKGVSDLKDLSKLSSMGGITIATYIFTTMMAVSIGLIAVNIIEPGNYIAEETREQLVNAYSSNANEKIDVANNQKNLGPLQPLVDMVPSNFFSAASNNRNMLQVIFFCNNFWNIYDFDSAKKIIANKELFDSLNDVILKIIDLIMLCAPYGVFALLAAIIVESPSMDLFKALGLYSITVLFGLILLICIYLIIVRVFLGKSPSYFLNGISPAQLLAFSTSSSAATLPVTMERVKDHLDVDEEVSSFVLPIGATINMDGSALYQAVAAVFIAQAFGLDLSLAAQLGIVTTATLASIGSAAVPGAGMVMLIIVLSQAGIPEIGLALIFAVDRPLDMCRTVVNVTGDATVSMFVNKIVRKKELNI